jgi:hypothetical protein
MARCGGPCRCHRAQRALSIGIPNSSHAWDCWKCVCILRASRHTRPTCAPQMGADSATATGLQGDMVRRSRSASPGGRKIPDVCDTDRHNLCDLYHWRSDSDTFLVRLCEVICCLDPSGFPVGLADGAAGERQLRLTGSTSGHPARHQLQGPERDIQQRFPGDPKWVQDDDIPSTCHARAVNRQF